MLFVNREAYELAGAYIIHNKTIRKSFYTNLTISRDFYILNSNLIHFV